MSGHDQKIKIVVLFGGQSAEHDVSCVTAAHVLRALDKHKYEVSTIGITRDGQFVEVKTDLESELLQLVAVGNNITSAEILRHTNSQTVVIPLLHGPMGEDGTIQGLLELLNVAYVGAGVLGSAIGMDKSIAKQILSANHIAQPKYLTMRAGDDRPAVIDRAIAELGLPVFVKPANMGSSIGVYKAKTRQEIAEAIDNACEYDEWILIEQAVVGREIEVAVLGNQVAKASVPGEIVPSHEFYDYEDKYLIDGAQLLVPAPLSPIQISEVQTLALKIFAILRCDGMARVDFFFEENGRGFLCNEINTIPGFTPISMYPKLWLASGVKYSELLDQLINLAIARHRRKRTKTSR